MLSTFFYARGIKPAGLFCYGGFVMDYEKFYRQMMYSVTMSIIRKALEDGVITQEEFDKADMMMREKYTPVLT